ncbi:hypothetical protein C8Q73DRAFT_669439 [Cubamyces lactineus]|nr:hypothetical protein C8Q73DRAFT_669439 [Cubamyces lactineus]
MTLAYRVGKRRVDGAHIFKLQQAKTERQPEYWRKYARGEDEDSNEERMRQNEPGVALGSRRSDVSMAPKYALKTVLYVALLEIGFTTVGGAANVGITLQPPLGLDGADLDLVVPWPTGKDGWWPYEYIPVANMLCDNYNMKAADFIEIPDRVDMVDAVRDRARTITQSNNWAKRPLC